MQGVFEMVKSIKINFDAVEAMLYFWQATSEKEKVGESYILSIGDFEDMKYFYSDNFDKESIRKVLSAISNRELLNGGSKEERKYWNNNMWVMEDLEFTDMMIQPVKKLNLDHMVEKLNEINGDFKDENIEVVFIPGHLDEYIIDGNKLIVNFFRIMPDLYVEDKVTIAEKDFNEYMEEKLIELVK